MKYEKVITSKNKSFSKALLIINNVVEYLDIKVKKEKEIEAVQSLNDIICNLNYLENVLNFLKHKNNKLKEKEVIL